MISPADYYFDEEEANRVCRFFESQLYHWAGIHKGKLFILLPWERTILRDIFGWKRVSDNSRRYRNAYIELPRKAGKTFFASGIALFLLSADHEPGAQIRSMAVNKEQAGYTFNNAKILTNQNPELAKRIHESRWSLEHLDSNSSYKAISGEKIGKHGGDIHGLIADELHEWTETHRYIWDAMQTSMGIRRQPLTIAITTAGYGGDHTICREFHDKATAYLDGTKAEDDTFYPVIFSSDGDWREEKTWYEANPSLGHTVSLDFMRRECIKAKESTAYENEFRRLYLNQWTEQATRWIDLQLYTSRVKKIDLEALKGRPCILGVDTGQNYDLTCIALLFFAEEKWQVAVRCYMPQGTIDKRTKTEGTKFISWARENHLIALPGNSTDYGLLEQDIHEIAKEYNVIEVAFDPWRSETIAQRLEEKGLTTVAVFQRSRDMPLACQHFYKRLIDGAIEIDDNPVIHWCAANIEVKANEYGDLHPQKPNREGTYAGSKQYNIDAMMAILIAVRRAMMQNINEINIDASESIAFL